MDEIPVLSRSPNPDRQFVEIRFLMPVEVCNIVDAKCMVESVNGAPKPRGNKLNEIVRQWAVQEQKNLNVMSAALRGNPSVMDTTADSGFGGL